MNTSIIKNYAPKACHDFITAITERALQLGISENNIEEADLSGDALTIGGQVFSAELAKPRQTLIHKIETHGFTSVIEHAAYTWFNRLCAIRYMELHDYLGHGFRVLSHPDKSEGFEILDHALDAASVLDLDREQIVNLKLSADSEEDLYRRLLLAQCHQLHQAVPELFSAIDSVTELLLPVNLTRTGSIVRDLVDSIPVENWDKVEIVGWLYQFYISEKKDQVMGKVVKSEDIPAATQLFTPNWIVQYLVQNSLGRLWLQTYPESPLKHEMPYYIEAGEQPQEVLDQIKALAPESINPETLKVLDPACGSGHILIEAYNVLFSIYTEQGYRQRDIPALILQKNLYGIDIDDRAAQMAAFALMMRARQDDRRIFSRGVELNVIALQEPTAIGLPTLWRHLNLAGKWDHNTTHDLFDEQKDFSALEADNDYQLIERNLKLFEQAKTLGSLIEVPAEECEALARIMDELKSASSTGESSQMADAGVLIPFIKQAWMLSQRYDAVIANPPYMGGKGMNKDLRDFAKIHYPNSKSDLFAMFMTRAFSFLKPAGYNAQINMQSWMFLSSYEKLREWLLENFTIITMAHLGPRAFDSIGGEVVSTTAFVIQNSHFPDYSGAFIRLVEGKSEAEKKDLLKKAIVQSASA